MLLATAGSAPLQFHTDLQPSMRWTVLKQCGFYPSNVMDVGANRGRWTKEAQRVWPTARYVLVEANPMLAKNLTSTGHEVHSALLAESVRNATYFDHADKHSGNGMMLERTHRLVSHAKAVRMRTTTLDEIADGRKFPLLKLDVQGAELLVLRGAQQVLQSVEVVFAELSVVQFNAGAPDWLTMQNELAALGFVAFDILQVHYLNKKLLQLDVAFARRSSSLWGCLERDGSLVPVQEAVAKQVLRQALVATPQSN